MERKIKQIVHFCFNNPKKTKRNVKNDGFWPNIPEVEV